MDNKSLYKIWDQVPVDYYQSGVKKNILQKFWHSQKQRICLKLLKNLKFINCLDIGCASGYMVSEITKKFPKANYFGVDVYDKAIKFAQKNYPNIDFKISSAEKLPFNDNSFDLCITYETIEHVKNPKNMISEMKRVLKVKGHVILGVDSGSLMFKMVWAVWEKSFGKVWQGAHISPFDHLKLQHLLKKEGFKIKKKLFTHFGMEVVFLLQK